jgi:nucleoside-diphosphate-sugar epimerase
LRYVISGSKGFLGSHLKKRLQEKEVPFVEFSFNNPETKLQESIDSGQDVFIHLAEPHSNSFSNERAISIENELYQIAEKLGPRFIYSSSALVYCRNNDLPKQISDPVCKIDAYTRLKIRREEQLISRNGTILRIGNVYGQDMHKESVIYKAFFSQHNAAPFSTSNNSIRDYVFVDDVVDLLASLQNHELTISRIYNVGSGQGICVSEIVYECMLFLGQNAKARMQEMNFPKPSNCGDAVVLKIDNVNTFPWWRPTRRFQEMIPSVFESFKKELFT